MSHCSTVSIRSTLLITFRDYLLLLLILAFSITFWISKLDLKLAEVKAEMEGMEGLEVKLDHLRLMAIQAWKRLFLSLNQMEELLV